MSTAVVMEHEQHHDHHEMPQSGSALTRVAISATLHCLTGCAIGEVLGMVIGTALGFSELETVALAVGLAFLFGYALTSLPLLRAGMAFSAVVPIALASDTLSIATMEIVDNALMLAIPGAMEAGVGSVLFWGSLSFALVIAGVIAVPVNRWLIGRGKGHAVVHETGIHGGPSPRAVGIAAAVAFAFGSSVLIAEVAGGSDGGDSAGGHGAMSAQPGHGAAPAGEHEAEAAAVRGLSSRAGGLELELARATMPRARAADLSFRVRERSGATVRKFDVEHDKRMHLIVVRRDLTGFQHLHPTMGADGTWTARLTLPEAGPYRVFADFKHDGRQETLAGDVQVAGAFDRIALPKPATTATAGDGYAVRLTGGSPRAGHEWQPGFEVTRDGQPVQVEPYLGARGHLVALRSSDLAFLHVHPVEQDGAQSGRVRFATEFATAGPHRLFLQFQHEGRVRTAAFTVDVAR
jgi:hypothetical protein